MKKFWIYLAMPMALINGCQGQQAALEDARELAVESSKEETGEASGEKGSGQEAAGTEAESSRSEKKAAGQDKEQTQDEDGESAKQAGIIQEAPFYGSTVSIARSEKAQATEITEEEIEAMVRQVAWDLNTVVKNGQTVVLKPNLVQMIVDSTGELLDDQVNGVTTDWRVTKAVLKMVRELNPDGKVYIMEGSATGPTRDVMEYFHYTDEYMEGVDGFICLEEDCGQWQDFDAPEVVKVDLPDGLLHKSYYFNKLLYDADVVISIPVLKTSSGVVVTAGIKNVSIGTPPGNLYGMGPDTPSKQKMVSHKIVDGELDRWIYDYYQARPVNYVIVDGLQGFQSGPVPMSHERKETDKMNMGIMLAGKDPVAVDTVCALTAGWDPQSVGYLNLFRERDGLGEIPDIRIRGSFVDQVRKPFTIYREHLGGTPVKEEAGPECLAETALDGDELVIRYQAGKEAVKVEVLVDGLFQYCEEARNQGEIRLTIPGISKGDHEIRVTAYDRFLNRSEVMFAPVCSGF